VKSAAEYLSYPSEAGVRALIKRGEVPVHRQPNGRVLLRADELDAWIAGAA
jgi:hypothetical protein